MNSMQTEVNIRFIVCQIQIRCPENSSLDQLYELHNLEIA